MHRSPLHKLKIVIRQLTYNELETRGSKEKQYRCEFLRMDIKVQQA